MVVNFWATWCAPCRKEMPELSALHAMRSNIEVVGLAYEDIAAPEMQSFLAKHPVTYPIVIVDPFDPPADFATPRGLPLTHLLDPQGKLAHTFLGPVTAADIESRSLLPSNGVGRQGRGPAPAVVPAAGRQQRQAIRGMAGRCRSAGTLQVRPCKQQPHPCG